MSVSIEQPTPARSRLSFFTQALPVVMGYIPIGFAYGVLAVNAGLTLFQTVLMSFIVYAGSSQFIAVGMFAQAALPGSIIMTTLIVNLRHMLMSAALAPHLSRWKNSQVAAFCYELTDETFGVHSLRFERGENQPGTTLLINLTCQLSWVLGSFLGGAAGNLIQDVRPLALDYALPAMFIALLLLQIRKPLQVGIAIFSGLFSMILWVIGFTDWNVIVATVIGAAIGAGVETWLKKQS
ncbi:MAG: branched-chain amino acid ABC transporter permease [Chloroflexi bacterium HGW-Chloroflexi-10]|nr:MAG: branched-chain amino acid ABC transporter permease [Chloroflexi bacterium HGW-Chloroflexi-10]